MKQPQTSREEAEKALLASIKERLPELKELLKKVSSDAYTEDAFYRFYQQSPKVYWLQEHTREIATVLQSLAPGRSLHGWFEQVIGDGTGRVLQMEDDRRWVQETRPIVEAFLHARTMLEFVVRYGTELDAPPRRIPSGWAAVLYLFGVR